MSTKRLWQKDLAITKQLIPSGSINHDQSSVLTITCEAAAAAAASTQKWPQMSGARQCTIEFQGRTARSGNGHSCLTWRERSSLSGGEVVELEVCDRRTRGRRPDCWQHDAKRLDGGRGRESACTGRGAGVGGRVPVVGGVREMESERESLLWVSSDGRRWGRESECVGQRAGGWDRVGALQGDC